MANNTNDNTIINDSKELEVKQKPQRFDYLDLMKAIAIIMVVIYHSGVVFYKVSNYTDSSYYFGIFFDSLLRVCVSIFFFVSGSLLLNTTKEFNLKKHIKRMLKLVLLAIIWGGLTTLLLMLIKPQTLTFSEFIKNSTFTLDWTNHLWFLAALFVIYFFYPLILMAVKKSDAFYIYLISFLFIFVFLPSFLEEIIRVFEVLKFQKGINVINVFSDYFSNFNPIRGIRGYSLFYFVLGGYLFKIKEKLLSKKMLIISIVSLILSNILYFIYVFLVQRNGISFDCIWEGYTSITGIVSVVSLFIIVLHWNSAKCFVGKFFLLIGKNTLGIYLIHWILVFIPFGLLFEPITVSAWIVPLLRFLLAFVRVLISLGLTIIMNKFKVTKWFVRI